jgi:hypothetical protein
MNGTRYHLLCIIVYALLAQPQRFAVSKKVDLLLVDRKLPKRTTKDLKGFQAESDAKD